MLNDFYIEEKVRNIDKFIFIVSMLMLSIIPIFTYKYQSMSISPVIMYNFYETGIKIDIFNFYKSILLYLGSTIILGLLIYKLMYLKQNIKINRFSIIIGIFILSIVISSIFSKYKYISLLGNFSRREGSLAWFCYMIITIAIINIKIDKKQLKYIFFALIPFLIINLVLILSNFYGHDLLKNGFVQFIIGVSTGVKLWTTLYHYNFLSGISSVIFATSFIYMLLENEIKQKVVLFLITIVSLIIVFTSNSVGGFITSIILIMIILPIAWQFVDKKCLCIWSMSTFLVSGVIYFILNSNNKKVYKETFELFEKINNVSVLIIPVIIVIYSLALYIIKKVNNKKKLFKNTVIVSTIIISAFILLYSYNLNKEEKLLENSQNINISRMSDSNLFKKMNEMSTDRLNIWEKTIRLINDKPIFGHGLDTFPYVFIPNDENGGLSTYGEIIDKPHNWYLSVAYGIGILGLICLLGILIYIIKGVFYSCVDKVKDKYIYIYSIGCIAFAIQGIFNDTLVGTSIVFWIFAGLCINRMNKEVS